MGGLRITSSKLFVFFILVLISCSGNQSSNTNSEQVQNNKFVVAKPTINIARNSTSHEVLSIIAQKLIETQIRYPVTIETYDVNDNLIEAIEQGKVDALLEVWSSELNDAELRQLDSIENLGVIGFQGRAGWFMPSYVLDEFPQLTSWESLQNRAISQIFASEKSGNQGRIIGRNQDREFDSEIINKTGLPLIVEYISDDVTLELELSELTNSDDPFLIKTKAPSYFSSKFSLVLIDTPTIENCVSDRALCTYVEENIFKVASPLLDDKAPIVLAALKNFQISQNDYDKMLARAADGEDSAIIAESWIAANEDIWSEWFQS